MTPATALHRALVARCREEGLLKPQSSGFVGRMALVLGGFGLGYTTLLTLPGFRLLACLLLSVVLVQAGMISHDTGHGQLSRHKAWNTFWGHLFTGVITGQAYGYWRQQHNAHHTRLNHPQNDPDLVSGWFRLVPGQQVEGRLGAWLAAHQTWTFWLVLLLQPLGIRRASTRFCLSSQASAGDRVAFVLHQLLWLVLPTWWMGLPEAIGWYLVLTFCTAPYLVASFVWNHLGNPTRGDRPYADEIFAGTTNLPGGWFKTWLFGGLNYHIEHHLCPSAPVRHLPRVRALLLEMAPRYGVRLHETPWHISMSRVASELRRLA